MKSKKTIKKNKKISLLIIAAIYVVSIAAGATALYLFKTFISNPVFNMLVADIICTIFIYFFSLIFKNASVYDPYWSVIPPFVVLGYYCCYGIEFKVFHLLVLIPLLVWALRLTINWTIEFDNLEWQDWRYTKLKKENPRIYQIICFTGIMLMPTLLVFAGTAPLWFFIHCSAFSWLHVLSGGMILCAVILQATADIQMKRFRRKNYGTGACIDCGIWRYCRHPNYFGEICVWWSITLSALGKNSLIMQSLNIAAPLFWSMVFLGAILITCLFVFISVPLMEKHILSSRTAYDDYKKVVKSPLIPFFRTAKK